MATKNKFAKQLEKATQTEVREVTAQEKTPDSNTNTIQPVSQEKKTKTKFKNKNVVASPAFAQQMSLLRIYTGDKTIPILEEMMEFYLNNADKNSLKQLSQEQILQIKSLGKN